MGVSTHIQMSTPTALLILCTQTQEAGVTHAACLPCTLLCRESTETNHTTCPVQAGIMGRSKYCRALCLRVLQIASVGIHID